MTPKELLKSANIYLNYSKNKTGTVFLTHSVVFGVRQGFSYWCVQAIYVAATICATVINMCIHTQRQIGSILTSLYEQPSQLS